MGEGFAPDLHWLTEDLAIGGSFPRGSAELLARQTGVGAVIDCRAEASDNPEELAACGVRFLHLPTEDHAALDPHHLEAGVRFARAAQADGLKLLIHCEHGIGRSATVGLCVLVDRRTAPLEALRLAKDVRALVSPSPAQYEAWVEWMRRWPIEADIPDFDAFKAVAYRHLVEQL